jgi:c(7)-type cytochrome triheme protein
MRLIANWTAAAAMAGFLGAAAAAPAAQSLPRLVDDLKIVRGADSPGQVLFNHTTHVDPARPECTSCHPSDFRILKANVGTKKIAHEKFDQGRQCGRCHDGKKAFAIDADCTNCHRG